VKTRQEKQREVLARKRMDSKAREERLRKKEKQKAARQEAAKRAAKRKVKRDDKPRILITSTQRPYYGGAATNAYALIRYFRSAGYRVAGVFFDNTSADVDPGKIGGVFRHKANRDTLRSVRTALGGNPDVIFAKNYAAPLLSKKIFPTTPLVYLVSGSPQMMEVSAKKISAMKYLRSNKVEPFRQEKEAFSISSKVIPNSEIGRLLLVKHYGNSSKIMDPIDTSLAREVNVEHRYFSKRRYDIAFVCSNMGRSVKNAALAKSIFSKIKTKKKIAIGRGSHIFSNSGTICHGEMTRDEVIHILCNTRLVICPSYYDASPNIIREALDCGANILVSKNCGWSELYPDAFVCEDVYNVDEWVSKANLLIKKNVAFPSKKKKGESKDALISLRRLIDG